MCIRSGIRHLASLHSTVLGCVSSSALNLLVFVWLVFYHIDIGIDIDIDIDIDIYIYMYTTYIIIYKHILTHIHICMYIDIL